MIELDRETAVAALKRLGWTNQGQIRGSLEIWTLTADSSLGFGQAARGPLYIPIDASTGDFQSLLDRAFDSLLNLYGKQLMPLLDLIRLRRSRHLLQLDVKRATDNASGLIQWHVGADMVESARGLLSSAARAASSPQKRFANAQSVIAEEYLRKCYMGQTQIGSYVVTALTPAGESFQTSRGDSAASRRLPKISGRDITKTLMSGLEAVTDGIAEFRSDGRIDVFDELVDHGVSFELLSSIERLTGDVDAGITVEFSTDDTFAESQTKEYAFDAADAQVIRLARESFELAPIPVSTRITGEVVLLKSSSADDEHRIKLNALVNRESRMVSVKLSEEQYDLAVSAHRAKKYFSVTGDLEQKLRSLSIDTPSRVKIEHDKIRGVADAAETTSVALWE